MEKKNLLFVLVCHTSYLFSTQVKLFILVCSMFECVSERERNTSRLCSCVRERERFGKERKPFLKYEELYTTNQYFS
jgi:hypothetical protein